ncbi:ATP-binding protein [bacterium]|nr:ATP-binding protein [bacterium]
MIKRDALTVLIRFAKEYPVVTVTGPRQSGKTTLVRSAFEEKPYFNLEHLSNYEFALNDPVGFMSQMPDGGIIDEIQKVPQLLSLIQVKVDEDKKKGQFIITGSSQFELTRGISQSLAGRTAILNLLPLSLNELANDNSILSNQVHMYKGFFPRIIDEGLNPTEALNFYYKTYVERDVRELLNIKNISQFQMFVKMCAGRVGQLLNLNSLSNDVGISHTTAREWLSVLQASFIVFLLEPYHENIGKRLMKSPKLYFYDVGLVSFLLGIEKEQQIITHPLYGNLFENMIVSEFLKYRFNQGKSNNLNFLRDSKGNEIDIFIKSGNDITAVEIKAGMTIKPDFFKGLKYFSKSFDIKHKLLVYGGEFNQNRTDADVVTSNNILTKMNELT